MELRSLSILQHKRYVLVIKILGPHIKTVLAILRILDLSHVISLVKSIHVNFDLVSPFNGFDHVIIHIFIYMCPYDNTLFMDYTGNF